MFLIEFVQDLLLKGLLINLNFRAIITYEEFEHYNLENVECYYGEALIWAYSKEKEINGVGLFMDKQLEKYNNIYKSCKYNSELNFVYLLRTILELKEVSEDKLPFPDELIDETLDYCWLPDEIAILHNYYKQLNEHKSPKVRAKYLQTYHFYRKLLPNIFTELEKNNFSIETISPYADWKAQIESR